jgi:hypothetical protein
MSNEGEFVAAREGVAMAGGQREGWHDGIVVLGFHAKCQVAEHVTPVCSFPTCNIGFALEGGFRLGSKYIYMLMYVKIG